MMPDTKTVVGMLFFVGFLIGLGALCYHNGVSDGYRNGYIDAQMHKKPKHSLDVPDDDSARGVRKYRD